MPLRKENTRTFQRCLYGTILEKVTLLKREDDQRQGVVKAIVLFEVRWGAIRKVGNTLQGDMVSDHHRMIHIPTIVLKKAGVHYLNALDRFVDKEGRTWQPEGDSPQDIRLLENHVCFDCKRADPPPTSGGQ